MKIRLGEKELDLSQAVPITLGDTRWLKKTYGVKLSELSQIDADIMSHVLHMLCRKVDPGVTEAEVDLITLPEIARLTEYLQTAAFTDADRPTSGSSTS